MTRIGGTGSAVIRAPAAVCFARAADFERAHEWQRIVKPGEVVERDGAGRPLVVEAEFDAIITTARLRLRLDYDEPRSTTVSRIGGDLRELEATWTFEERADGTTLATFAVSLDPGRALSLAARGPMLDRLRALIAEQPPVGLKADLEGEAPRQPAAVGTD